MLKARGYNLTVLGLFFCSGATALVYEVVWSKCLSLMFGSTIHAQTVVLAVFMGGLALGNRLFGRKADRLRQPVRAYGFIELAIALYAIAFVTFYGWADRTFVALGSNFLDKPFLLLSLKALLSVGLLLIPTVLMGGTLPLLAAWLQTQSGDASQKSARFYAVNSLGAVGGAAAAGFYLVQTAGIASALQITALVNALIGGMAILLSRSESRKGAPKFSEAKPAEAGPALSASLGQAAWTVAITGGISMGLEVLASRALALVFGSSLQSFAIVLMAFILGIGLGSTAVASAWFRRWPSARVIVGLLLAAAAWTGLLIFNIEWGVNIYRHLRLGIARTDTGYIFHQILTGLIAMGALGLPAALIGAVLPLFIRTLPKDGACLGEIVGRLLTWNTLGAVIGVLFTGFVLMPRMGLRGAIGTLAVLLGVLAFLIAWQRRVRWGTPLAGGFTAGVALLLLTGGEGWRHVMSSGVFRARETTFDRQWMAHRKEGLKIDFYEDAPDATVTVERTELADVGPVLYLRVNGKTDATSRGDLATQLLLGHLPMLVRPESKDVFVLGLGSGITGGAILQHPVEHLAIAENCEPVVRAARLFERWNHGVLTNPATRLWVEDARTVLKLSPKIYDIIVSEPSNPWTVGVGSVFSREFYELASSRLKEDGLIAQWFHIYEIDDAVVSLVLRTFSGVFPHMEVWDTCGGDIILLGSKVPWPTTIDRLRIGFAREAVRRDLGAIGISGPSALLARQLASQRTAFAIAGDGPNQSDWFPVIEYAAPRAFYLGGSSQMLVKFDERTWQSELASSEKRRELASLDETTLQSIFRENESVNGELNGHLRWRFRCRVAGTGDVPLDSLPSPCVFRPGKILSNTNLIPANASSETYRVWAAGEWIERNPERKAEGVNIIAEALRHRGAESKWPSTHFALLAAKASLASGDAEKARSVIRSGLESAPNDDQLEYLKRVTERYDAISPQLSAAQ
jgi:predicted membrane-bound spermidine synthase